MIYHIYGLRLRGDREIRYVGVTRNMQARLRKHFYRSDIWSRQKPLIAWIRGNRPNIEIFEIERIAERGQPFETRAAALAAERDAITICLKLGQRLFNQTHVPHELRIAA